MVAGWFAQHSAIRTGTRKTSTRFTQPHAEDQLMTARGLLLALDYSPAPGGIARLLDGWIVDTAEIEWLVLTTTTGPESERVVRTTRRMMPVVAALTGRRWLRGADERVGVASQPSL